jgi:hypothetical protein
VDREYDSRDRGYDRHAVESRDRRLVDEKDYSGDRHRRGISLKESCRL